MNFKSLKIQYTCYDVYMMNRTFLNLSNIDDKELKIILQNALLESLLIHSRKIIDFLFAEEKSETDISARDFLKEIDFKKLLKEKTSEITELKKRINKEIIHSTTIRMEDTVKSFPRKKTVECINSKFKIFLDKVEDREFKIFYEKYKDIWFKA